MPPSYTPVPNILFDKYLTELKPAELKVILVVIRQTLGWTTNKATGNRKHRDWLSGGFLINKTGLSRRAITSAIDSLTRRGIVEVTDYQGNTLYLSESRQGKTRLYFRLNLQPVQNYHLTCANFAQELVQKMLITKETHTKEKHYKKANAIHRQIISR